MVALDCVFTNGAKAEYEFDRPRYGVRALRQFARRGLVQTAKLFLGDCCIAEALNGGIIISDALKRPASNYLSIKIKIHS